MRKALLIAIAIWTACFAFAQAQVRDAASDQQVSFNSAVYPPTPFRLRLAKKKGTAPVLIVGQQLSGRLLKPAGVGPFPAIVLMHGCHGIGAWNRAWADRLSQWGYVILDVDSFGPRGHTSVCGRGTVVAGATRALDAHGARKYLSSLTFVAPERIAVMGMSHGGWATLNAINGATTARLKLSPFRAAVAMYPYCAGPAKLDAPLMILIGELDDWTPAKRCRSFVKRLQTLQVLKLKIYPEAHHLFDVKGIDKTQLGHVLRYHPEAAKDAIERVRVFLAKNV